MSKRAGDTEALPSKKSRTEGDHNAKQTKAPKKCGGQGGNCLTNAKKECVNGMCRSCCAVTGNACVIHEYDGSLKAVQSRDAKKCKGKSAKCPINAKKECVNGMCKTCCSTTGKACEIHEYDGKSTVPVGGPKKCGGKGGKCPTNAKKECTNSMCRACCSTTGKICNIHGFEKSYDPKTAGPKTCAGKGGKCVTFAKKECLNTMCRICCLKTGIDCAIHNK